MGIVIGAMMLMMLNKKRRKWIFLWLKIYFLQMKLFLLSDHFSRFRQVRVATYQKFLDMLNS